jgi:hypothetical protein
VHAPIDLGAARVERQSKRDVRHLRGGESGPPEVRMSLVKQYVQEAHHHGSIRCRR